jgi:nicotinamidase-related amidase
MGELLQSISYESLAVLIIDMQDSFIKNDPEKRGLVANQIIMLRYLKDKNVPIIIFDFVGHGETTQSLVDEIKILPVNNIYRLKKSENNAFTNPKLSTLLKEKKITTLLLMGINAAYCVWATADAAIKKGYTIITSKDLIAGYYGNDWELHCDGPEWYMENGVYVDEHNKILQHINY